MNDSRFIERYSRQMLLPSIERSGQEILKDSRVVLVGVGGLGSSCLMYLGKYFNNIITL
jgi:adenylyltransferase/sulfurtransferase